ncbi:MAG: glycosyltransferase family 9 protein [Verrucomicrobiales bacterium]
MKTLIIKLGATGDVVRTSTLLRVLEGEVTWVTTAKNRVYVEGLDASDVRPEALTVWAWEERERLAGQAFDLAICLEDDVETAQVLKNVSVGRLFGAYQAADGTMAYTDDAYRWFDLSLISRYGREAADQHKLVNRHTYQELVFDGLGYPFTNEGYCLPPTTASPLHGDVAIAPEAGPVWPMKKWAHYEKLKSELEARGLKVNHLPKRDTLLEHLADVRGHRAIVCGDSLPMHLALGSGIRTVALFNCTSPWEIYDYGLLTKIVSPLLEEYFYKRGFEERATTAIGLEEVLTATLDALG